MKGGKGGRSERERTGTGKKHPGHHRGGLVVPVVWRVCLLFSLSPVFGPLSLFSRFRGFSSVSLFSAWLNRARCVAVL
jgi:hypothetical protein